MAWFAKKKQCVHCKDKMTSREFEEQPTCADCKTKILNSRELTITCPVDGTTMVKENKHEIIIDRCPKCNGVWLDAGEIDAIKEAAHSTGVAIGMIF
jgi:hypothetical protein